MQITLKEWLAQHQYASLDEALADYSEMDDSKHHMNPHIPAAECGT